MSQDGSSHKQPGWRNLAILSTVALVGVVGLSTLLVHALASMKHRPSPVAQAATVAQDAGKTDVQELEETSEMLTAALAPGGPETATAAPSGAPLDPAELPLLWAVRKGDGLLSLDGLADEAWIVPTSTGLDRSSFTDEAYAIVTSPVRATDLGYVSRLKFAGAGGAGSTGGGSGYASGAGVGMSDPRVSTTSDAATVDSGGAAPDNPAPDVNNDPSTGGSGDTGSAGSGGSSGIFLPNLTLTGNPSDVGASLYPSLNGVTIFSDLSGNGNGGGVFTADGGSGGGGAAGGARVDLEQVPEPSTLLIFGCGMVLLARALKSRRVP